MLFIRRHAVNPGHTSRAEMHRRTELSWPASMTSADPSRSSPPRARDRQQATALDGVVCHAEQGLNSGLSGTALLKLRAMIRGGRA
jgi:hypothetical protein